MKIIGIIADFVKNDTSFLKTEYYRIRDKYVKSVEPYINNDTIVIFIPYLYNKIDKYVKLCDGIILHGGDDIPPEMYGEKSILTDEQITSERYKFEIPFIKKYIKTKKPIFGICAGLQSINVACGGTLYQDIEDITTEWHKQNKDFNTPVHQVNIEKDTLFYNLFKKEKIYTNSMHHQAIKKLGENLLITAKSNDNIIEAVELKNHPFCIGVQWHPEWKASEIDNLLFKLFCEKVLVD